jgi:ABC-type protease/lipase transport system fused ATPase/permease subunit
MIMAKGRQQQFGPKEQILARFTAQTNPASRPLKVVSQPVAER